MTEIVRADAYIATDLIGERVIIQVDEGAKEAARAFGKRVGVVRAVFIQTFQIDSMSVNEAALVVQLDSDGQLVTLPVMHVRVLD